MILFVTFQFLSEENLGMWGSNIYCAVSVQNCSADFLPDYSLKRVAQRPPAMGWTQSCPSSLHSWTDLAHGRTTRQLTSLQCHLLTPHLQPHPFTRTKCWQMSWVQDTTFISSGYTQKYASLKSIWRKWVKITRTVCRGIHICNKPYRTYCLNAKEASRENKDRQQYSPGKLVGQKTVWEFPVWLWQLSGDRLHCQILSYADIPLHTPYLHQTEIRLLSSKPQTKLEAAAIFVMEYQCNVHLNFVCSLPFLFPHPN